MLTNKKTDVRIMKLNASTPTSVFQLYTLDLGLKTPNFRL